LFIIIDFFYVGVQCKEIGSRALADRVRCISRLRPLI